MATTDYTTYFDAVPDGLVTYDPGTGEILAVNDALCEMVDTRRSELLGADVSALGGERATLSLTEDAVLRQAETGAPVTFEWSLDGQDGSPVEVRLATRTREGREVGIASLRDRGRGSRERTASPGRDNGGDPYRALFESEQLIVWELDLSGAIGELDRLADRTDDVAAFLAAHPDRHEQLLGGAEITDANRTAVETYGADSKRHLRENFGRILTEEAMGTWRDLWAVVAAGETGFQGECVTRSFDGDEVAILFELAVPEGHADRYDRVYAVALDVTDRNHRRRELEAARRTRRTLGEVLAETAPADEFADAVCEELTGMDDVTFAWVGSVADDGDLVEYLAGAGEVARADVGVQSAANGEGDVDLDRDRDRDREGDGDGTHPAAVAVREGDSRIRRGGDGTGSDPDRGPGTPGTATGTVVAVPVTLGEVTRGVLVAGLADGRTLDEDRLLALVEESADVLGHALGSRQRRRALATDEDVELTVEVGTGDTALSRAAAADDGATVTAAIPRGDGLTLCYLTVEGGDPGAFVAAAGGTEGIERVERIGDGSARLQVLTSGPVPSAVVAEHGGVAVESRVGAATTTLTVQLPRGTATEPVLEALESRFGSVQTTRYTSEPTDPARDGNGDPTEALTDRQREVLEAAFRSGYFERPRAQSASEVADSLGVVQQSYQQVLRAAQRNLCSAVFDDGA